MPAGLSGALVLACVTWDPDHLQELSTAASVTDMQIATLCSAVGGVCGWSCGSTHSPENLQGHNCKYNPNEIDEDELTSAMWAYVKTRPPVSVDAAGDPIVKGASARLT
eukprot:Skav216212  [mRNA]  locus=scaffold238:236467:239627:- [translate_table: standard]